MSAAGGRREAVILAGGRSRRMGSEKALLPLGGGTVIERLALRLAGSKVHCINFCISILRHTHDNGVPVWGEPGREGHTREITQNFLSTSVYVKNLNPWNLAVI